MGCVLLIRQGNVPTDPRVARDIEALLAAGHEVDVISRRIKGHSHFERARGLTIRRLPLSDRRGTKGTYVFQYSIFFFMATVLVTWLHIRRRYDLVQVHSVPDTLVFAAIWPKLTGTPVLLDLQEAMPEFFASKFGCSMTHPLVRILILLEQLAITFADHVLTCTNQMRDAFVGRGALDAKITVILNSANERVFDPARFPPRPRTADRFVLVSHGTIERRYGLDTTIEAVARLKEEVPNLHFHVIGEGEFKPQLRKLVRDLRLEDNVSFSEGFLPVDEMVKNIAEADVGVVAMQRDMFRDLTHCNKMFDFITMRRPQIVSRTGSVEAYFDGDCFQFFTAGNVEELADAIRVLRDSPERCEHLVEHAMTVNERYRWPKQREIYLAVVRRLLERHPATERHGRGRKHSEEDFG